MITTAKAAADLGISQRAVQKRIQRLKMPVLRAGGVILLKPSQVRKIADESGKPGPKSNNHKGLQAKPEKEETNALYFEIVGGNCYNLPKMRNTSDIPILKKMKEHQNAKQGAVGMHESPSTIELEKILNGEDEKPVHIAPDGSVHDC